MPSATYSAESEILAALANMGDFPACREQLHAR
jgi:hypothetical protein